MSRGSEYGGKRTKEAGCETVASIAAASCAHGSGDTLNGLRSQRKKPWRDGLTIVSLRLQEQGSCNIKDLAAGACFLSSWLKMKGILLSRPSPAGLPTKLSTGLVDTCLEAKKRQKTANIG
jgi:hypothetical protein